MAYVSTVPNIITASCPTACFIWKTERPFKDVSRKSRDFSFLGAVWWLEAEYVLNNNAYYFRVTFKKKTGTVSGTSHVDITTIIDVNNSHSVYGGTVYYHKRQFPIQTQSETVLWELPSTYVTGYCTDFLNQQAWKIVCVFHDILPPVYKIDNIRVDSSTQTDEDLLPTTAEKCTQASRDFSDLEKLSEDFSSLLSLSLQPDAKLRCGDRTLPVHRSVLAARSPVLGTMFQNEDTDTLDVTDVDERTLDLLLEYVYSGVVLELSDDTAVDLYGAGSKYGMDSLRKACSNWMVEHLTSENCVSFLAAASSCVDVPLEEAVASFLCGHPEVFGSPSWIRLAEEHQPLAYKIIYMYTMRNLEQR